MQATQEKRKTHNQNDKNEFLEVWSDPATRWCGAKTKQIWATEDKVKTIEDKIDGLSMPRLSEDEWWSARRAQSYGERTAHNLVDLDWALQVLLEYA